MSKKLQRLAEVEGYSSFDELIENTLIDDVSIGICMNPECDYTCDVEADCQNGWCENCSQNTVKSALILAGVI